MPITAGAGVHHTQLTAGSGVPITAGAGSAPHLIYSWFRPRDTYYSWFRGAYYSWCWKCPTLNLQLVQGCPTLYSWFRGALHSTYSWFRGALHFTAGSGVPYTQLTAGSGGAPHSNPRATASCVTVVLSGSIWKPNSFSVTTLPFGIVNCSRTLLSYITALAERAME